MVGLRTGSAVEVQANSRLLTMILILVIAGQRAVAVCRFVYDGIRLKAVRRSPVDDNLLLCVEQIDQLEGQLGLLPSVGGVGAPTNPVESVVAPLQALDLVDQGVADQSLAVEHAVPFVDNGGEAEVVGLEEIDVLQDLKVLLVAGVVITVEFELVPVADVVASSQQFGNVLPRDPAEPGVLVFFDELGRRLDLYVFQHF